MKEIADQIERTIGLHAQVIRRMTDAEFELRKVPGKWSKKEIVGHLIDSAQNNIQRFVRGQYEVVPKIVYAQEDWVRLQNYQDYDRESLVTFWVMLNKHLCWILQDMNPANYERNCNTGDSQEKLHTLSFLAKDYLVHLLHHLNQIEQEISIK